MKLIVLIPLKGSSEGPRLVQFVLETEEEMVRFANFYAKDNPTLAALLDVLLGKQQDKLPDDNQSQVIQINDNQKVEHGTQNGHQ